MEEHIKNILYDEVALSTTVRQVKLTTLIVSNATDIYINFKQSQMSQCKVA